MVFLSHHHRAAHLLRPIVEAVVAGGATVWIADPSRLGLLAADIRRNILSLSPGANWQDEMKEAIEESSCVLTCLTNDGLRDPNGPLVAELNRGRVLGKLVVCQLERIQDNLLPAALTDRFVIDLSPEQDAESLKIALGALVQDVRATARRVQRKMESENPGSRDFRRSVFVSYRRADTSHATGRLHDRLVERLGEHEVFVDLDGIQPGTDFKRVLAEQVSSAAVVLAMIGPDWLDHLNSRRKRFLTPQEDYVAFELQEALERDRFVLPILIDGAQMPARNSLPRALARLSELNSLPLNFGRGFNREAAQIVTSVQTQLHKR